MGLDWNPIGKPKRGHEEEFEKLFYMLGDNRVPGSNWQSRLKRIFSRFDSDAATKRWFEIQISPFITIQAPQVGSDAEAEEWARTRYRENPLKDKSESQFLENLKDHYVVALAPPCDGIPYYSNGDAGYVELYSFRAQFISVDCKEIVGDELLERCYQSCLAPGLASLGTALRNCAVSYATRNGVSGVEAVRELDAPEDSAESKAHILFSAAKWCEYWSSREHGLEAYF